MNIAVCDDNINELTRISSLLEDYRSKADSSVSYDVSKAHRPD